VRTRPTTFQLIQANAEGPLLTAHQTPMSEFLQ
jgi:hypothetical protein